MPDLTDAEKVEVLEGFGWWFDPEMKVYVHPVTELGYDLETAWKVLFSLRPRLKGKTFLQLKAVFKRYRRT